MAYCKSITFGDSQWGNLIQLSQTSSFFQQQSWLQIWMKNFPIEYEIVGIIEDEKLIGIAPISISGEQVSILGTTPILGKEQVCDFGDIVCLPQKEDLVWKSLREYLSKKYGGKTFLIRFIKESSPSFPILKSISSNATIVETSPYISLPTSWEEYLEMLEKKDRHELKRKLRRLETANYRVYRADPIEENNRQFISLMKQSAPEKARFMTGPMERYFIDILTQIGTDQLMLWFMDINSHPVAGVIAFKYKGEMLLYNSGMNLAYKHLSVGLITKTLLIKYSIELGIKTFDFFQGNEHYKYDLGAKDNNLYQFTITL